MKQKGPENSEPFLYELSCGLEQTGPELRQESSE